jgi:RNA polymerase sigma factor (sigma-70 family)
MENYKQYLTKEHIKLDLNEITNLFNNLTPSNENKLVKSMMPMAYQLATKYWYNDHIEDIIAVANLGILKGIRTFNPNNITNATILTYCKTCASNEIINYIKKNTSIIRKPATYHNFDKEKKETFATAYTHDDITLFEKYINEDINNYKIINECQLREILIKLGKPIKEKHIDIFILYYVYEMTYEEIAPIFDITKQYVGQVINQVLEKINNKPKVKQALAEILF